MKMQSLKCPNWNGPYNPAKRACEYCGSYIIFTDLKEENYSSGLFNGGTKPDNYKGIYVYGILLDYDEYPVRMGVANYKKSMLNAVGGHLLLTNKRLAFISHAFNIGGKMALDLPLNHLKEAQIGANFGISGQYSVFDIANNKYTFVVYGQKEWTNRTNNAIAGKVGPLGNADSKQTSPALDYAKELVELKKLLDAGIITQEDYDIKKRMILKI